MNKAFEKILERLEEDARFYNSASDVDQNIRSGLIIAKEAVQEVAEEYNSGWIPCSEQLPDYGESVLVSFNKAIQPLIATFYENDAWKMLQGVNELINITNEVIAWQPLPQPYQPKGE